MGLSHLPAPQPAWTRREPGGAHENPETIIRPTALDVSTCTPDLSPLRRPAGPVQLSGMAEDGADARPGPRGGQPPGAVSERTVCGGTPAPAVRRSAASCPASLDLWRRCPGAHGLGARSTPRYLPRDAHGTGLPGPHLGVPRAFSLSTALSPAPGLPRASAPSPPGPDCPAAGGREDRPRWPGTPRRRATHVVDPCTPSWLALTKRLAVSAGSAHVRSLPATTAAPGVADCGRAPRQANGRGPGRGHGLPQQALSVLAGPFSAPPGRAAGRGRGGLQDGAAPPRAPARRRRAQSRIPYGAEPSRPLYGHRPRAKTAPSAGSARGPSPATTGAPAVPPR